MTEELDFTRKNIKRLCERLVAGELSDADLHQAAANTEKILREGGSDITVKYMGPFRERLDYNPYPKLSRIMGITFEKPKPRQTTFEVSQ